MARRMKMLPVAARYFDLLAEEGFRPTCDRIDDTVSAVLFKVEGTKVVVFTDEEDESFFHLGLGIELNEGMEIPWALDRANQLNDDLKAVKVTIHAEDRTVRFRIEAFLPGSPTLEMIRRSVGAIDNAAKQFFATEEAPKRLDA